MMGDGFHSRSMFGLDMAMAGLRAAQRGLIAGCTILAGLPPWVIPPLLGLIIGSLGWAESRSRRIGVQAAIDGGLGGLAGVGAASLLLPFMGPLAWPVGLSFGCGGVGSTIAALESLIQAAPASQSDGSSGSEQGPPS